MAIKHTCADCGRDCTMGTPDGPPYVAIDGVTRCWRCERTATEKRARIAAAAPEMLAALEEIVSEWGFPNTAKWHRAHDALVKARGAVPGDDK